MRELDVPEFDTLKDAYAYVAPLVEQRITRRQQQLAPGFTFRSFVLELGGGAFTNVYDVSWEPEAAEGTIHFPPALMSPFDYAQGAAGCMVAVGAGFFFLADKYERSPRQFGLNLALSDGRLHGLPSSDRDTIICRGGRLEVQHVPAYGWLELNGRRLSWAGSLSGHRADTFVYGNANLVIEHENHQFDAPRVLQNESCFTSDLSARSGWADVGFIAERPNVFCGSMASVTGRVDLTAYDLVLRCPLEYLRRNQSPRLQVLSIGQLNLDGSVTGAVSAGASLHADTFLHHPLNRDRSLGSLPPLADQRLARLMFYRTVDGLSHLRLFDGWRLSDVFTGVTPDEAVALIGRDTIEWGCTLDSGRSAKIVIAQDGEVCGYGNHHYIQWPTSQRPGGYRWVPEAGRPVASLLGLTAG